MLVRKRFAAALATLAIALSPCVFAEEALAAEEAMGAERVAAITFDLLILRPGGLARFLLGSVIAPIACPLALATGDAEDVMQRLVGQPAEYTFLRELGDF